MKRRFLRVGTSLPDEVDDEVRFHLEEQTRALIAGGMTAEAARKEALRMFGNRERIRDDMLAIDTRRVREERRSAMLQDLHLDIRYALRYLRRRPGFGVVAVGVLALGIGASTAVFSVVDAALLRPLPFPDASRVVRLSDLQPDMAPGERGVNVSYPEVQDWQREMSFLHALSGFVTNATTLQAGDEPERVIAAHVLGDYTAVMQRSPVVGRYFSAEELAAGAPVVLLSESFWRRSFGASDRVVGQSLRIGDAAFTIIGVMPREANVLSARDDIELWRPYAAPEWATRGLHYVSVFARVPDTMSLAAAEARIETVAQALRASGVTDHGVQVERVRDRLVADSRPLLLALGAAVACLLLIVCANLANLFLSHGSARRGEFAVRAALGAGRMRVTRQLLTEAVIVAVLGGALGWLFARVATRAVAAVAGGAAMLLEQDGIDMRVLFFTALVSLLSAGVIGLWPALRVTGSTLADALKAGAGRSTPGRASARSRRVLVTVEIALSVVLLAGSALLIRSLMLLLDEDPGFRAENVLKFDVSLPGSRYDETRQAQLFQDLVTRIRSTPGVLSAGGVNELPLGGGDVNGGIGIVGREFAPDETPVAKKRVVTAGYFETMGIPVRAGRTFEDRDRAGSLDVAVISESLARRYWPDGNAVGQRIQYNWGPGDEQQIIGVVGDVRHDGLDADVQGMIYRPIAQFPFAGLSVVVRTKDDPYALVASVRAHVRSIDPALPIDDVISMRDVVRASVSARTTMMVLLTGFAAIALVLAAVGVYAITAQSVAQRTREIGLRKALGAADGDVLRLVVGEESIVLACGLALGIAAALLGTPLLASVLHGISTRDPLALIAASAVLASVALLAVYVPARRAASLDPVRALAADA